MEQNQAIQIARDHVMQKTLRIDERSIRAMRMPAKSLIGIDRFQGDVWIVHLSVMESENVVESVNEIIVIVSDDTGEVGTIRGL
ncbi:MAG: hypothetical protein WC869_14135 [Phycisphaerae bacterium]|jgi:hypothetical protein